MTWITTMVQSLTQPNILECEVKQALGSITTSKASGGDGIPAELFQILRDDAVKVLHSTSQQIWKIQLQPQDWKRSVFIPIPKKDNAKEMFRLSNNCTHFTCQQDYAQNSSSQVSAVCESRTYSCTSQVQKRQRNQRSNCQHPLDHRKSKEILKNLLLLH